MGGKFSPLYAKGWGGSWRKLPPLGQNLGGEVGSAEFASPPLWGGSKESPKSLPPHSGGEVTRNFGNPSPPWWGGSKISAPQAPKNRFLTVFSKGESKFFAPAALLNQTPLERCLQSTYRRFRLQIPKCYFPPKQQCHGGEVEFTSPPNENALGGKLELYILLPPPTMGGKEIALPPFMQTHGGEVFFYCPPIVWGGSGSYVQRVFQLQRRF